MERYTLPGIRSVEVAEEPRLIFDRLTPLDFGTEVDPQGDFSDCKAEGLGSFEAVSSVKNGIILWTSTLTFYTRDGVTAESAPVCYRFKDVEGNVYLIGSGSRPYPVVTVKDTNPEDVTTRRAKTVSVEWTSTIGVLKVIHG
jgi:hypothetical protein